MLAVLGLILFIGTGLAGGIQLYRQNLKTVRAAAESYMSMLRLEVQEVDVGAIVQHAQDIREFYERYIEYLEANPDDEINDKTFRQFGEGLSEEVVELSRAWFETALFVLAFGNLSKDIECDYVVIPEENDLVYIWDSEMDDDGSAMPFEHFPYSGKEKEHIQAVMRGEKESDHFTEYVEGELIETTLQPVYDTDGRICAVAAIDVSVSGIQKACLTLLFHIGAVICLIMLISITVYHYLLRKQILSPIKAISDSMIRFSGDSRTKPEPLNIRSRDEIGEIAESFEKMTEDISSYVSSIEDLTRERVQNNVELEVARRIQNGMVPEQCHMESEGYRVRALTRPARAVGGDFYDCFLQDENSVCVFMGDVSGKGISAAIFMAMTKTIIREKLLAGLSPAEALYQTNNELCTQNPGYLFATVFAAVLSLKTGKLRYANAGHTPPVMLKKEPEYLQVDSGIALGLIEDAAIKDDCLHLAGGEGILLYTDGVTEAMNPQKAFFGTDRLLDAVRMPPAEEKPHEDVVVRISRAVNSFVEGSEPFDDMAALALYRTGEDICELTVDQRSFDIIKEIVLEAAGNTLQARKVLLVCDEVLSNIVSYSGAKTLAFSCRKLDAELHLCFTDDGVPFDPTTAEIKEKEVHELDQGGMGLSIIRKSVSSFRYERKDSRNNLFMTFRLEDE